MSIKSVARNVVAVIAGLFGVIGVFCLVSVLLGFRPFILTSPSMEPLYPKGSLVWADTKVDLDAVDIGDVLVYRAPSGNLVMHRLVGANTLQGDANNTAQEVVLNRTNYVGREAFCLPWVGDTVATVLGVKWIVFVLVGVFLILACIPKRKVLET